LLGELTGVCSCATGSGGTLPLLRFVSWVADLAAVAVVLRDPPDPVAVTRDPNEDYLVALAVAAQADALISGDRDLTELEDPPVPVLTPRTFLDRVGESK
jgi:predicted nucleic acid-binding protein